MEDHEKRRNMVNIVEEALLTDGAHHKQAALYELLQLLEPVRAECYEKFGGDIGVPD